MYDPFLRWAPTGIDIRSRMKALVLEVHYAQITDTSIFKLCQANISSAWNAWKYKLTASPDPTLNAIYTDMSKTLGDGLLECLNSAPPYDEVQPYLDAYAALAARESQRLYQIHAQAERYGESWRWPQGLSIGA